MQIDAHVLAATAALLHSPDDEASSAATPAAATSAELAIAKAAAADKEAAKGALESQVAELRAALTAAEASGAGARALEAEKTALQDEYFTSRRLYPNVDFYSGICFRALGVPRNMFTVVFAVARSVGWISQWCEMAGEKPQRISRPRQMYTGAQERRFVPVAERGDGDEEEDEGSFGSLESVEKRIVDVRVAMPHP